MYEISSWIFGICVWGLIFSAPVGMLLAGIARAAEQRDGTSCAHRWLDKDGHAVTIIVDGECVYANQFPNIKPLFVRKRGE